MPQRKVASKARCNGPVSHFRFSATAPEDKDPTKNRECYFDFKVTDSKEVGAATNQAKADLAAAKNKLGACNSMKI